MWNLKNCPNLFDKWTDRNYNEKVVGMGVCAPHRMLFLTKSDDKGKDGSSIWTVVRHITLKQKTDESAPLHCIHKRAADQFLIIRLLTLTAGQVSMRLTELHTARANSRKENKT